MLAVGEKCSSFFGAILCILSQLGKTYAYPDESVTYQSPYPWKNICVFPMNIYVHYYGYATGDIFKFPKEPGEPWDKT